MPERDSLHCDAEVVAWLLAIWAAGSLGFLVVESVDGCDSGGASLTRRPAIRQSSRVWPRLRPRLGLGPVRVLTLPGSESPFV